MLTADAPMVGAEEAAHLRRSVFAAPMYTEPSPYLYAESLFTPSTYASILRLFPTGSSALRRWSNPGEPALRFGNYDRRREINLNEHADRLPPEQRAFWTEMTAFLCGRELARTLLDRFADFARSRFGAELDDPAFVEERLRGTVILNEHDAGYYLGPHTDRSEKVFTVLLYFPERDGLDHLGTTLYRPLQRGFTCDGRGHYDPALFERGETIPYRPNSALIFARTDVMFHGVHALSADQLQGSRRRGIQMQFWVSNARRRELCKTGLRIAVPATMHAETERRVAFALTNRAAAELESSLPYATQLGYRWIADDGGAVEAAAVRTPLPAAVAPGATLAGEMRVVAPPAPGRYVLRLSVVQEGVAWFDDVDPDNGAAGAVTVWNGDRVSPEEILPATHDVALGAGWFPLEREDGAAFRWVDNDAVVHVAALEPVHHALCLLVEPGPGVAPEPLLLTAALEDGDELGTVSVAARELVRFALPVKRPAAFSVVLHARRGGKTSPNDPRALNFRVFNVAVERRGDVFPAWARPARGFYPLERYAGSAFRWVGGEAGIVLDRAHGETLSFDVESGPGFGSRPFALRAVAPDGTEIVRAQIAARATVDVPLGALHGAAALTLSADGGGRIVDGDPRTLNYRVFPAGTQRRNGCAMP